MTVETSGKKKKKKRSAHKRSQAAKDRRAAKWAKHKAGRKGLMRRIQPKGASGRKYHDLGLLTKTWSRGYKMYTHTHTHTHIHRYGCDYRSIVRAMQM